MRSKKRVRQKLIMARKSIEYTTEGGVCSKSMIVEVEDNIIKKVQIIGGCPGNTSGLSQLLIGMEIDEAIRRLEGIDCRGLGTSCPDQMSKALSLLRNRK